MFNPPPAHGIPDSPANWRRGLPPFEHYNHARAHESLGNLTPADVYFGSGEAILQERARIKRQTLIDRRLRHHAQAA